MLQRYTRWTIAFAVALALAGCGGSGSGIDTSAVSKLTLAGVGDFNGTPTPITAGLATTTTVGGNTVATIVDGTRTLTVTIPGTSISAGDSFDVGPRGATAVYSEVISRDAHTYVWTGVGGRITIEATTGDHSASISVNGVRFDAAILVEGNPATGSFTLQGNLAGFPISGGGGIGGLANLSFSDQSGTNADTSGFLSPIIGYAQINNAGTLAATIGSGDALRVFTVELTANASAGDTIDLTGTENTKAIATFSQGAGTGTKIWIATGGTLRVVSRSQTKARVQFVRANFSNLTSGDNQATGSFTVNGTISRL